MNDLVRLAMDRAVARFGKRGDGLFNAAGFGVELMRLAGHKGVLDGGLVRVILAGRTDVDPLQGGAHFRLRAGGPEARA